MTTEPTRLRRCVRQEDGVELKATAEALIILMGNLNIGLPNIINKAEARAILARSGWIEADEPATEKSNEGLRGA